MDQTISGQKNEDSFIDSESSTRLRGKEKPSDIIGAGFC